MPISDSDVLTLWSSISAGSRLHRLFAVANRRIPFETLEQWRHLPLRERDVFLVEVMTTGAPLLIINYRQNTNIGT
jgi:hypothetical protein